LDGRERNGLPTFGPAPGNGGALPEKGQAQLSLLLDAREKCPPLEGSA